MSDSIDICLISPPNRSSSAVVPVALLYLHAWLTKNNISSKIIDIKLGRPGITLTKNQLEQVSSNILEKVKTLKPRYIGIPCYTSEFWDVINLCKRIKASHKCTIIVGGLHVGIKMDDFFFEGTPIDIAVAGDGQYPLVEIIRRIDAGKSMEGIEGVIFRSEEAKLFMQGISSFEDWDTLPNPDYSQLDMSYYSKPHTGIIRNLIVSGIHIFTAIGCPFSCTFCANSNRKVRYRPIARVVEEIEGLKNNYNIDSFYIFDETFLLKKSRVTEFVEELKNRKIDLIWAMETRVDRINEEVTKLISEAGCIQIDFGVESGSNEALVRMKKEITEEEILRAFDICRKYNLRTLANFMFNTPGETERDVEKTLEMMRKTSPTRLGICLTVPFPGTAIYNEYVKPPLTKEEYEIYNTPYLYFKAVDSRFYMAKHRMDMTNLRIKATAKANKLRSIMDYTFNPAYWRAVLKSKKKTLYLKVLAGDFLALSIARLRNSLKMFQFFKKTGSGK
jgi:anaerobic magnesium-protoporphyrin IX monomethyl ester cyclase